MKKIISINIAVFILSSSMYAVNVDNFIDLKVCDKIFNTKIYNICYSYKHKSALVGWSKITGDNVYKKNIEKRPLFYIEKSIQRKYRTKYSDYTNKKKDRGHFAASDASFDYDKETLALTYNMINIVPQFPNTNRYTWIKVENYTRKKAVEFGYVNTITIADFAEVLGVLKNGMSVASGFYKIIFNNKYKYKECFYYKNEKNPNLDKDKLLNHLVECSKVKYSY